MPSFLRTVFAKSVDFVNKILKKATKKKLVFSQDAKAGKSKVKGINRPKPGKDAPLVKPASDKVDQLEKLNIQLQTSLSQAENRKISTQTETCSQEVCAQTDHEKQKIVNSEENQVPPKDISHRKNTECETKPQKPAEDSCTAKPVGGFKIPDRQAGNKCKANFCRFSNQFNNCWMNSATQSITNLKSVRRALQNCSRGNLSLPRTSFSDFFLKAVNNPGKFFSSKEIFPVLKRLSTTFPSLRLKQQNDIVDFLEPVMNWLEKCGVRSSLQVNQVSQCDRCGWNSTVTSPLSSVCFLSMPEDDDSTSSLLLRMWSEGSDAKPCGVCGAETTSSVSFNSPDVVVLNLPRMSAWTEDRKSVRPDATLSIPQESGTETYVLSSVICHKVLTSYMEHFYTYVNYENQTIKANDSSISFASTKDKADLYKNGIIYVYESRNKCTGGEWGPIQDGIKNDISIVPMVPPDVQNEVLMSLLETDPDVVDYLLRRKASQTPDILQSEEPFTLNERHSSSDSNKASSGEVSPYDNNSPVLSERRGEPGSPANEQQQYSVVGQEAGLESWGFKDEHVNIWGTWHSTLKPALKNQSCTGSHGNMSEESSPSSQEGLDGLHGDVKPPTLAQRTQTTPGNLECRPHPPVTRVCSGPNLETGRPRLKLSINVSASPHLNSNSQGLLRATGQGVNDGHCPPPYNARHRLANSQSSPQLLSPQQPHPQHARLSDSPSTRLVPQSPEWRDWQRDRYQIWQLLSSDNADTLPETLV